MPSLERASLLHGSQRNSPWLYQRSVIPEFRTVSRSSSIQRWPQMLPTIIPDLACSAASGSLLRQGGMKQVGTKGGINHILCPNFCSYPADNSGEIARRRVDLASSSAMTESGIPSAHRFWSSIKYVHNGAPKLSFKAIALRASSGK